MTTKKLTKLIEKNNEMKGKKSAYEDQVKTLQKERDRFEKKLTKTSKDYSKKDQKIDRLEEELKKYKINLKQ